MAINYETATGQVRLLIADVDEANLVLNDDQVAGFLALNGAADPLGLDADVAVVKLAAADALDAIATSEALVSKVIRTQDLSTDGPKTAAALRDHATRLRAQVADAAAAAAASGDDASSGVFEVVEFTPYPRVL